MSGFVTFFVALILGAIFGLIHPPFDLWYIGIWALPAAAWWARMRGRTYRIGWAFGLGYFFVVMHWIYEPFQVEQDIFGWLGVPAWLAMAAGLALFWLPIFRFQKHGVWFVAVTFIAMEYLRGHVLTGFPWALTAYGFADTPFAQSASVIGSYGLSFAITLCALLIAGPLHHYYRAIGVLFLGVLAMPELLRGLPSDQTYADFNVTLVQANVTQKESVEYWNAPEFVARNRALSQTQTDLIIWPEGTISYDVSNETDIRQGIMSGLSAPLIIGTPYSDGADYFNSAHLINTDGEVLFRYDKTHLVPFGERFPLADFWQKLGINMGVLTRFSMEKGKLREWNVDGLPPINILICYEGIFPRYARRDGAFIALITNDAWFGKLGGPSQHLAAVRFRAIESGKPVARVAKTGITAMIDARGQFIERIPLDQAGSITTPIGAKYESTIYHKIWDYPLFAIILGSLGFLLFKRRLEP